MRRYLTKTSLTLLLLIAVAVPKAHGQNSFLTDRTLSQLRGVWEYRTYRDKWTLAFESDHKMLLDREPADYALIPGAIRIEDGDGSTDYPYTFQGGGLALTLPDGSTRTYRKSNAGEAEQLIHGTYHSLANSSLSRESFLFDGDHSFAFVYPSSADTGQYPSDKDYKDRHESMSEARGVYRVEADKLILAFDDGTTSESQIRNRDDDNSVADIVFQDQVFETDRPVASAPVEQISLASQPPPPDHGPILIGDPQPVIIIVTPPPAFVVAPPAAEKSTAKTESKPRDFGSTRSKAGAR